MSGKNKIVVNREPFDGVCSFMLACIEDGRIVSVAGKITLDTPPKPGEIIQPFMALGDEDTQSLMDELWRVGFRPREGTGSAGALAATERHLEDMRTLVFTAYTQKEKKQ